MKILVAESAGFCFGVSRSVEMAADLLRENGRALSFGELIHNEDVVSDLEKKGLKVISSVSEVCPGDPVLIRAHGISKALCAELENAGAVVHDATCPRVKAIHKIVSNASAAGRFVIIIGMRNHPEVEAIRGWCAESAVLENEEETQAYLSAHPNLAEKPITVVVQTTQTHTNFNNCINLIKKLCTNTELFDTICLATFTRQNEAADLSQNCDAMVVIGGKHSANSVHLAEICSASCDKVLFIERSDELDRAFFSGCETVGITAGASTPSWIIKEVRNIMDEIKVAETEIQEAVETAEVKVEEVAEQVEAVPAGEPSFDMMLEESLKPIYNGDKVTGIVTAISGTEVTVDLGTKYTGFIPTEDFTLSGEKIEDVVKFGDEVEAIVVRVNDVEGTAMLSKKRLDSVKFWEAIENASESGEVVEGTVVEENKGGVVVNVKGVRVFVPASQTDLPREADLAQLLKKNVKLKISEVNKARKRVVGSIRRAASAERSALREKIWNEIEVGKKYVGTVKSLTNYGAFVDIGGIDGMVHVTELTWGRIRHPSEVVSVGDELNVYVIGFDKENRRISLGYKDPEAQPWSVFTSQYAVGDVASVKIVKLMPFGAFAELVPGVDGLIHISQLADHRVEKADDAVKVGDVVDVKITAIDEEKQKVSLSIRALLQPEAEAEEAEEASEEPAEE
ncbi:MAG: bifunctional 4-hydroxy-3-methylbut-2-enyl diphosphate reductase/30S ribosomal protein S1 [Eubacteriales bacterium]|nr:bifunctional 4-hydroxy-3-methylbut-2-enyl diphosphate reductase/30S ribosomal protein S1 [Eubacteriales bacterium]